MKEQRYGVGEGPGKTNTPLQNQGLTLSTRPSGYLPWGKEGQAREVWGMRYAGHGRSRGGPGYLLGSREGMVEAGHVSHDGFFIWAGGSDDVCREQTEVRCS